jgi:uncharacterized protein related to proFAR isomerase
MIRESPGWRAGILVPDLDEFERQNPRFLAMVGVERDRAVIVDIGVRHVNSVQFGADNLTHLLVLPVSRRAPAEAFAAP